MRGLGLKWKARENTYYSPSDFIHVCFCRRLILSILSIFYCREVTEDENYNFSSSGSYFAPPEVCQLKDESNSLNREHETQFIFNPVTVVRFVEQVSVIYVKAWVTLLTLVSA